MKKIILLLLCIQCVCFASQNSQNKLRILLGSPIHQKPEILKEFLASVQGLNNDSFILDYFFIDDDNIQESKDLLKDFNNLKTNCLIFSSKNDNREKTSNEAEKSISKTANFKDLIIQKALNENYDYLFLVDSDIVMHPKTLKQLIEAKKDIISNIFWTKSYVNSDLFPQVWLNDKMLKQNSQKGISNEKNDKKIHDFITKLKNPGIYEVGGLKACSLISKSALNKNLSFQKIYNLSMHDEDYYFCVRAAVNGLSLFVDTHYPAFHIYNESDLAEVKNYKQTFLKTPRLTLSMIIKDETNHYLKKVLENAKKYITDAVIIDNGSEDNSAVICLEVLKGIPLHLVTNTKLKFSNEVELRKLQWEETIKTDPEWILILDADEIFEEKFENKVKDLISSKDIDAYCFRAYDFWDENHYRDDEDWVSSRYHNPFLIRYNPNIDYKWLEKTQNCGRFPKTVLQFKTALSDLRIKHYGFAKHEDRLLKYQKRNSNNTCDTNVQYESILDENPRLIQWEE